MKNATDLRNELIEVFKGLRNGEVEIKDAVELNNTAGKIINSAKVQLAYHALRGERPEIEFLGDSPVEDAPTVLMQSSSLLKKPWPGASAVHRIDDKVT